MGIGKTLAQKKAPKHTRVSEPKFQGKILPKMFSLILQEVSAKRIESK